MAAITSKNMQRMMLDPRRLAALLDPQGFQLLDCETISKTIHFGRPSSIPALLEGLCIHSQGKKGEAVYASTWVSAVQYLLPHPYVMDEENDHFQVLETDPRRHWALLKNKYDAIAWEKRLAELADSSCRFTTAAKGPGLLQRLQDQLVTLDEYKILAGDLYSIFDSEFLYHSQATFQEIKERDRLLSSFPIWNETNDDFQLSCLLLAKYGSKVEGIESPFEGKKPREDPGLFALIYLLADYIRQFRLQYRDQRYL